MIEVAKTKLRNLVPSLPLNTVKSSQWQQTIGGRGGAFGAIGREG